MNDVRLTNVAVIKSLIRGMSMSIFNSRKREKILENYLEFNSDKLYRLAFIYVKNKDESLDVLQDSIAVSYTHLDVYKRQALGAGGLGNLGIRYGFQRFQTDIMIVTVIVLIIVVQALQGLGNYFYKKLSR